MPTNLGALMGLSPGLLDQLDAIGDWGLLATDKNLTITGWNRWLVQRSGIAAEDAIGRRLFAIFPELESRGLDRYFRQALLGQTAILSQRFHKYILPLPSPISASDPDRMQQSARIVPLVTDGVVEGTLTIIEDATERVFREADLQLRNRQQAALAFSARSALAGFDIAELCRESARHLAETIGADFTEALELQPDGSWARLAGVGWSESATTVFRATEATRILAALQPHEPVTEESGENSHSQSDAHLRAHGVLSSLVVRIPGRGSRVFGLLGAYSRTRRRFKPDEFQFAQALADIIGAAVERKTLEAELRVRAEELAEADRRKDEFLAMLAHELRNPLAPVRNAVQILQAMRGDDPVVARLTEMLSRQVRHMAHMVDDLLDVSRITRGKVDLRKEHVLLADAVARAVEVARPLIDGRRHELSVSVPADPILLDADPTRLTQILGNLLNNAAKYTEDGGHIWISAIRFGSDVVIRVRDTGIGLAPEMISRVFDLFTQANRTLDRSQGGLGIGLTLVRSLVEMHGGTVSAESEGMGRGSEFVVRLPALADHTNESEVQKTRTPAVAASRRLLIVDDNVDSAESMAELLALVGHEVRIAHDGPAALREAEAHKPDVILLDIGLPRMNGYEVVRRIREDLDLQNATLIAMTGYGQDEDRRKTHEAGFDHHLVKPVSLEQVSRILQSIAVVQ